VLAIHATAVEWLERAPDGSLRAGCVAAESGGLLAAVLEARRAASAEARRFVLALAHPHSFWKLFAMPPLAAKDLGQVFRRRARAMAGEGAGQPFFVALPMDRGEAAEGKERQDSWLLAGVQSGVRDLRLALRDRGLRAERVVSLELAALEWGRRHAPKPDQATVVVVVGEDALSVSLVAGEVVHYQESIEGNLATRPALAAGLVHEIKTCAAYWKKRSRGAGIAQVVVVGMPRSRVELLAVGLGSVLPGAAVHGIADREATAGAGSPLVEAAFGLGPACPELSFWLPQRARAVGLAAGLLLTLLAGASVAWLDRARGTTHGLRAEAQALRRSTADLEELLARCAEGDESVARIRARIERQAALAARGLPLERTLGLVMAALEGRAELDELYLADSEQGPRLSVEGRCSSDPARMLVDLRAVLARLERADGVTDVSISLSSEIGREAGAQTGFALGASLGG
jgi:hypothetical protein